jgi:hypothetical protein
VSTRFFICMCIAVEAIYFQSFKFIRIHTHVHIKLNVLMVQAQTLLAQHITWNLNVQFRMFALFCCIFLCGIYLHIYLCTYCNCSECCGNKKGIRKRLKIKPSDFCKFASLYKCTIVTRIKSRVKMSQKNKISCMYIQVYFLVSWIVLKRTFSRRFQFSERQSMTTTNYFCFIWHRPMSYHTIWIDHIVCCKVLYDTKIICSVNNSFKMKMQH